MFFGGGILVDKWEIGLASQQWNLPPTMKLSGKVVDLQVHRGKERMEKEKDKKWIDYFGDLKRA